MTYIGPKYLRSRLSNKQKVDKFLKKESLSVLKKKLQEKFNLYIRLRDTQHEQIRFRKRVDENGIKTGSWQWYFVCISCGHPKPVDQMNAGHLYPVGNNEAIRYDEDNCHAQCIACNLHKHGNQLAYYKNLVKKIGQERMNRLEFKRKSLAKFQRFEILEMIEKYDEKIKALKCR